MTAPRKPHDPYVRLYHSVVRDHPVLDDDRAFATWVRLTMVADLMWPNATPIPLGVHRPTFRKLVEAGLVTECSRQTYHAVQLNDDRTKRAAAATRVPTDG